MRLKSAFIRPVGTPVRFTFEGREIEALEGETIAAALSAAGIVAFRRTASGAPRGLHCGMGACYDCVVTVDGRIGQRACLTKVAAGSVVSGQWSVVSDQTSEAEEWACGVLVVGGGPAGLSAAIAAAEAAAEVVLLDERTALGGQYAKPLAESHIDRAPDRQFRFGEELRRRATAAGVRIETEATVWGAFGSGEIAALIRGRAVTLRPKCLILAPGAHERPVPLPGWTLPGVMTTGALQGLVRTQRVCPGKRVLIAGNGPLNLQLACELLACGVKSVAVVEAAPRPGPGAWELMRWAPDLAWQGLGMLARLKVAGVPVVWNTEVAALEGDNRVRRALAGRHEFAVDVVALNLGFQPETGIARALGIPHRFVDRGAGYLATEADEEGRTPLRMVFAVGDGADLGGARVAAARGRLAGLAAARDLDFAAPEDRATRQELRRALRFQEVLWRLFRPPVFAPERLPDEVVVCRCEEVTAGQVRAALAEGLASLPAVKKATRAGMGRCQGRFCAATVARMCPGVPDEFGFAAPRAPVRPTPVGALMFEAQEFEAPLLDAPASPRVLPRSGGEGDRDEAEVVVLGGGLMGLCSALFLARDGVDVLVIERDEAGMAASTANAGSLHVQLLSYNFEEDGPEDGGPAGHMLPLAPQSIALWKEIGAEAGEDLGIRTEGGLMVADSEPAMRWLRKKSEMERRLGIESHLLGANELRSLAPAISERMIGADFVPAEGYGDPLRGTMAVLKLALKAGVRLMPGSEARGLARERSRWVVSTGRGEVRAGKVVNATGPWAGAIGGMIGLRLPVSGTVQQVIATEPVPQQMARHLIAYAKRHLSLKQQISGGFLIGGGWFGEVDPATGRTRNLRRSIEGNLWVCGQVLPALRGLHFIRSWTGLSPVTDGAPILGEAPGAPGFFNVVSGNGYTLAPILGRLTAEAVQGRRVDPRYTLARFG